MYASVLDLKSPCPLCGKEPALWGVWPDFDEETELLKKALGEDERNWAVCGICISVLEEIIGMDIRVYDDEELMREDEEMLSRDIQVAALHLSEKGRRDLAILSDEGVCPQCRRALKNMKLHCTWGEGAVTYFDEFSAYCSE